MSSRSRDLQLFDEVFKTNRDDPFTFPPDWVCRAIGRRVRSGRVTIVSAVCPDYDRQDGKFTYRALGTGVPFTAQQHLLVVKRLQDALATRGVELRYVMTLADTEFDLPLVLESLSGGSADEFLRRCQLSCDALMVAAREAGVNLEDCRRFTDVFPDWFNLYGQAVEHFTAEAQASSSVGQDLILKSHSRIPLYRAMAGQTVGADYCRNMVLRQWAQYAVWGELATRAFGNDIVMMNHDTPNLTCVNSPLFRAGRERIPILRLGITTMPE